MPIYEYQCKNCQNVKTVFHLMSEIENPIPETVEKITCCNSKMSRIITAVRLNAFTSANPEKRMEILDKRANEHYRKEIEPLKREKIKEAWSNM